MQTLGCPTVPLPNKLNTGFPKRKLKCKETTIMHEPRLYLQIHIYRFDITDAYPEFHQFCPKL